MTRLASSRGIPFRDTTWPWLGLHSVLQCRVPWMLPQLCGLSSIGKIFKRSFSSVNGCFLSGSRDSSCGIAAGYRLDGHGSVNDRNNTCFSSPQRSDRLSGSPRLLSNGYRRHFPGDKEIGAWNYPLSPSSAKVVMDGGAISSLPYASSWSGTN
jgi:hypothetical protein